MSDVGYFCAPYIPVVKFVRQNFYISDLTQHETGWGSVPYFTRRENVEFMNRVRSYHLSVQVEKFGGAYIVNVLESLLPIRPLAAKKYLEKVVGEIDLFVVDDYSMGLLEEIYGDVKESLIPVIHVRDYQILLEYQKIL